MLQKVYRELMILGFISFSVVVSNELDLMSSRYLMAFELAHLLVFGVSMSYVTVTVTTAWRLQRTENEWSRMAQISTNELADDLNAALEKIRKSDNIFGKKPGEFGFFGKGWMPLWRQVYKIAGRDLWEDAEWKVLRLLFLQEFHIGTEFNYSKYVRKKLEDRLGHSLHIHGSTWGTIILSALLFLAVEGVGLIDLSAEDRAAEGHRRLAAKEAFPSTCNFMQQSSDSDEDASTSWTCTANRMYIYQPTVNDTRQRICLLEKYHTYEEPESGWGMILFPIFVAWITCFAQTWVVISVKTGLHSVLECHDCPNAQALPEYLRRLNAQVTMKSLLTYVPMFEGCGEGFLDAIMTQLSCRFCSANEVICRRGDDGSSMYFICEGKADVVTGRGIVLGTLSAGDFAGEMAVLLDQPRTANIVARSDCTVFELERSAVQIAGEQFPAAMEIITHFAANRASLAAAGNFDTQANLAAKQSESDAITAEAVRLRELEAEKARIEASKDPESSLKITGIMPHFGKLALKDANKMGAVITKKATDTMTNMMRDPKGQILDGSKKVAKLVGLPGTGVVAPASSYAHHRSLDRMAQADSIMPMERGHLNEEITEIALLFNCFNFAWWGLRMMPFTIPNFHSGFVGTCLIHFFLLFPIMLTALRLVPLTTKLASLLDSVLFKDEDMIAATYQTLMEMISVKEQIVKALVKVGVELADREGSDPDEGPPSLEVTWSCALCASV